MLKFCQKRGRVFPSGGKGRRRRDLLRFKTGLGMRLRRGVCVTGVCQVTGRVRLLAGAHRLLSFNYCLPVLQFKNMATHSLETRFARWCAALWWLGAFFLGFADIPVSADETVLVGVASADITPDYPVRLSGYGGRRTEHVGVAQRIGLQALAMGPDSRGLAVLVTIDNCSVPWALRAEVLRRVREAGVLLADERFAIAFSHTHCAPMLEGALENLFGMDIPEDHRERIHRYTEDVTRWMTDAVLKAVRLREPSFLALGFGRVGFAANRRSFPDKPVDHDVPVLRVTDLGGRLRVVLAGYACHCTTIGIDAIHGDWAGCAREALERDFPGAVGMIAIGCGADQNPNPRRTMELVKQYGEDLAAEVGRVIRGEGMRSVAGAIACRAERIPLEYATLPTREEWNVLASKSGAVGYHARRNIARLERGEMLPTALPYWIQTWSFGDALHMVFLPGEVTVDYGLRLKREFDRDRLWVNAYSNESACYIPSRRVLEEGGYEGGGAMVYYDRPTKFAWDVEERIIAAVRRLLPSSALRRDAAR